MGSTDTAVRNGVDTATLFATLDAVRDQPDLAQFQFRTTNRWVSGTHSESSINGFYGAGEEQTRDKTFRYDGDHPAVLVGQDNGPTPVEYLLHAIAACITAGVGNIAAARGVELTRVESTVRGDLNLLGLLGFSDDVRNGYEKIQVDIEIEGNAPEDKLRAVVEQSKSRSAVYDVLTNGVPVEIDVKAA